MAGRPRIFDQAEVLNKTIELFWKNGYEATSTNDILKEVNLNKGSLYNVFKSKKELFQTGLAELEVNALDRLEISLDSSEEPIIAIKNIFYTMVEATVDEDCKGCILGNSIVEFTNKENELKEQARSYLLRFESILEKNIRRAQESGQLKNQEAATLLAKYLINFWNGINISRRVYTNKEELKELIDLNLIIFY